MKLDNRDTGCMCTAMIYISDKYIKIRKDKKLVFRCSMFFFRALCVIPASIPMFWQTIASCVKSRTAQECQFQHQGQSLVPNKREALGKNGTAVAKKRLGQKGNCDLNCS